MGLIRQIDYDAELPEDAEGGVWTRCGACHAGLDTPAVCAEHPGSGVDVRILTAARLTPERRAAVEVLLLGQVWADDPVEA
jgi:hypothetical protein